jgi:hypothetical protein
MNSKSEYNRGVNFSKVYYSKFRSFYKDSQGRIIGNTKSGSTEVLGRMSQFKPGRNDYGFTKGAYDEMKKIIQSKMYVKKTQKFLSPVDKINKFGVLGFT